MVYCESSILVWCFIVSFPQIATRTVRVRMECFLIDRQWISINVHKGPDSEFIFRSFEGRNANLAGLCSFECVFDPRKKRGPAILPPDRSSRRDPFARVQISSLFSQGFQCFLVFALADKNWDCSSSRPLQKSRSTSSGQLIVTLTDSNDKNSPCPDFLYHSAFSYHTGHLPNA